MLREIVLDTETTGLSPEDGHRIVEIGCIELINRFPSGVEWHFYFNPDRDMPEEAFQVHGISAASLADKPRFAELAQHLVEFLGDATLIAHNAPFDIKFLNAELKAVGGPQFSMDRVVDTLALARRKHPGAPASLDALCKRYGIDTTVRNKHGALIDCKLLADVYVEMLGERQARLELANTSAGLAEMAASTSRSSAGPQPARQRPRPIAPRLTPEEAAAHAAMVANLGTKALWNEVASDASEVHSAAQGR
jgi:DNA polymerase-3 subunit epsilon